MDRCEMGSISNITIVGSGNAIEIRNSTLFNIDNVNINNFKKGIIIDNSYDIEVTNVNMNNLYHKYRISNLTYSIRLIMYSYFN